MKDQRASPATSEDATFATEYGFLRRIVKHRFAYFPGSEWVYGPVVLAYVLMAGGIKVAYSASGAVTAAIVGVCSMASVVVLWRLRRATQNRLAKEFDGKQDPLVTDGPRHSEDRNRLVCVGTRREVERLGTRLNCGSTNGFEKVPHVSHLILEPAAERILMAVPAMIVALVVLDKTQPLLVIGIGIVGITCASVLFSIIWSRSYYVHGTQLIESALYSRRHPMRRYRAINLEEARGICSFPDKVLEVRSEWSTIRIPINNVTASWTLIVAVTGRLLRSKLIE